jgi:uncharacterized membrane protein
MSIEQDKPKEKFKKKDKQPLDMYSQDEQKRMKEELQSNFGMDIMLLMMAAENNGFKPKSQFESNQKKANAASIYLMSMFCGSSHGMISSFTQAMTMSDSNKPSFGNKFKFNR